MSRFLPPIVAVQGLWVRVSTVRLAVAGGEAAGTAGSAGMGEDAGEDTGEDTRVRIAVVGESTAAGVGVPSHGEGFGGCLASAIAERTRRWVEWEAIGEHGANARRIHTALAPRVPAGLDAVVLLAGVNDVLERREPRSWGGDLTALVAILADRAKHVVVTGIPSFTMFPSLPRRLGRFLSGHAAALDAVSREVCAARQRATWFDTLAIAPVTPGFFARDGFHPSAAGYHRWAGAVAEHLEECGALR